MDEIAVSQLTAPLRVLYVEDDAFLRVETGALLEEFFAKVLYASDGKEGLEVFEAHKERLDLLITDINMPRMNGIELIRAIKERDENFPVIIISAHNETELFLDSIQTGVNAYILKPLQYEQFIDTLGKTARVICAMKENVAYKQHLENAIEKKTEELEENYQKLQRALTTDLVTSLPNQASLHEELYCMGRDTRLSVMVFDVDHFSGFNDFLGYEVADELLFKIGTMLRYILPEDALLYRETSDEFVVLLQESTKYVPEEIAQQAISFFKETPIAHKEEEDVYVSFSIGISVRASARTALLKARTALHELKEAGLAGKYQVYVKDSAFSLTQKHNALWIHKARKALEEDRVVPFFQPIVAMDSGAHVKYECLARLRETDGSILMPLYFIEPLRLSGLMGNLTRMLVKKCYETFKHNTFPFSINLSHEDIMDHEFVDFLIKRTELSHMDPSRVILEILEDAVIDKGATYANDALARLRSVGFKIALDDFGAERSNYSRLEKIPCDILKIDGQFIRNIDALPHKETIVKTIVKMAQGMGLEVIAEHVATRQEKEVLERLGVRLAQGFYFSQPLEALPDGC